MSNNEQSEQENKPVKKIMELNQGESFISVKARVLEASESKTIETRKGPRTISEAVIGDDTGRIKTTLWGEKAGELEEGKAVQITGAWTTGYRGKVQLNIGSKSEITEISDDEVPSEEEIPEEEPTVPYEPRRSYGPPRRDYRQGGYRKREW